MNAWLDDSHIDSCSNQCGCSSEDVAVDVGQVGKIDLPYTRYTTFGTSPTLALAPRLARLAA